VETGSSTGSNSENVFEKLSPKSTFVKEGAPKNNETTNKGDGFSGTSSTKPEKA